MKFSFYVSTKQGEKQNRKRGLAAKVQAMGQSVTHVTLKAVDQKMAELQRDACGDATAQPLAFEETQSREDQSLS